MLRALRIGMVGEVHVDDTGSGAQVCEKQASSMAWQLFLLLPLPQSFVTSAAFYDTQEQFKSKTQVQTPSWTCRRLGREPDPDPNLRLCV